MNIELIIGLVIVLLLIVLLIISISTKLEMRKQKTQGFEVQIFPWKENIEEGHFFKKQSIQIGYQYQLFINGIPCLQPHIQILETVVVNKLDEENINIAIKGLQNTITALASIHPSVKAVGDCSQIASTLLSLAAKK
jgi:hypothetical protein